jgi:lysyl oxidase
VTHARFIRAVALVILVGAAAAAPAHDEPGSDPLPDLVPLPGSLETPRLAEEGGRVLLRFPAAIANLGDGPLEVAGRRRSPRLPMRAFQVIFGDHHRILNQVGVGDFAYDKDVRHWGLLLGVEYRLLPLHEGDEGEPHILHHPQEDEALASRAVSVCLLDNFRTAGLPGSSAKQRYRTCPRSRTALSLRAGLSAGWGTELPEGWLDVTGVPGGDYLLQCEVNPRGLLQEQSLDNNFVSVPVHIP